MIWSNTIPTNGDAFPAKGIPHESLEKTHCHCVVVHVQRE